VSAVDTTLTGSPELLALGWEPFFERSFALIDEPGREAGRVVAEHRGAYRVATAGGEITAQLAGRLRYDANGRPDLPVVGDWVALDGPAIVAILDRRTVFARRDPDPRVGEQLLAANVDTAFLMTSVNRDFNLRRLERYLAMTWSSGASPVLVLTKTDLADDLGGRLAAVSSVAVDVPVVAVSAVRGEGLDEVRRFLAPGRTVAFLGSSGVGKSTLLNALAGREVAATGEIRLDDARGRHTTTGRQLVRLPAGWLVIDTPGLREVGLTADDAGAADGLERTFADVEALAAECRFSDCRHEREPGCAVRAALADGRLDRARLESHRKLEREVARSVRATDPAARAAHRAKWRAIHRAVNDHLNRKYGAER
jgi:ribosome biogenesis GTPase